MLTAPPPEQAAENPAPQKRATSARDPTFFIIILTSEAVSLRLRANPLARRPVRHGRGRRWRGGAGRTPPPCRRRRGGRRGRNGRSWRRRPALRPAFRSGPADPAPAETPTPAPGCRRGALARRCAALAPRWPATPSSMAPVSRRRGAGFGRRRDGT